ncbi:Acetyl-coenzyme A synthetase [Pseudomonas tremae]|uniref:Acetyl-coenzyme A synthetase n=7 Tax=Pseudomonas syringae group TaxID=136849 RepID=A0AA40P093_9PSED|nr:Acetyl-CoA synthetase [Pseudomonas coronafaciens pv. oryzae]KPY90747.1 Acetyl-coenzyme A synthetase [Pseudomonas tremae]RMN28919.1 Acetyl-CoA synthetase [Pseudomonas coronafaciens pv. zizaniae]RMN87948.1 Acetyl-coenzyme A synthetase [Pseudomonas coronafaciens pv. coronafaciens]RMR98964.1 Acetyl-coenzyme A synthetase [Pseudomonas coronafaciens pv. garcae]RMT53660.1 Acetyl-coenzyme A synthetase [Pseudomonas coronafaciens pv. atropurpurea]RMV96344.1 Acetyl-coenzyme A synthetase [Pseudomonas c
MAPRGVAGYNGCIKQQLSTEVTKMSAASLYPVRPEVAATTLTDEATYKAMYQQSVVNPDGFWREQAQRLDWIKPFTVVKQTSFDDHRVDIKWFADGTLNVAYNCLDRHLAERGDSIAIIWEGDDPSEHREITYRELHEEVCKFANALRGQDVHRGDVVTIYMPMIPEAVVAMLACARIGAIHSVVFGGFSPEALAGRIIDCSSKVVITADEGLRGGKKTALKANVDRALTNPETSSVQKVIVCKRTGGEIEWNRHRDIWYHALLEVASSTCAPKEMGAEESLFILYTSGSTGKPKGVLHTTAGYLLYAALTHERVFDYKPGEVYWCTADVGWVTGHSYIVYGPLANGATTLLFEGVPNYPDITRVSKIIDKHKVNILYTAPTAIRAMMAEGTKSVEGADGSSLRLLGSVGEPINPEAWGWYYNTVGKQNCPIVDTWWQTETGGILISPLPGATALKPGSATRPFFGVIPALVDNLGNLIEGAAEGNLVILDSWPGQSRTLYGDHDRFVDTYFKTFRGMYFTGDGARRDEDGYFWITGRVDDVLNVSGHRMGTAEIESAMVAHPKVAEAAVVGVPHDLKGQGIYVYVTLNAGEEPSDALRTELRNWVRKEIGPIASPDFIQWAPGLPKTRSGKIMRRILRKIATAEYDALGDISTLADPGVVQHLIDTHKTMNAA